MESVLPLREEKKTAPRDELAGERERESREKVASTISIIPETTAPRNRSGGKLKSPHG